jgi:hypothetical protein
VGLNTPSTYCIPCECGLVYIRQTGCLIELKIKEHQWYLILLQTDKSALAAHVLLATIKFSLTT